MYVFDTLPIFLVVVAYVVFFPGDYLAHLGFRLAKESRCLPTDPESHNMQESLWSRDEQDQGQGSQPMINTRDMVWINAELPIPSERPLFLGNPLPVSPKRKSWRLPSYSCKMAQRKTLLCRWQRRYAGVSHGQAQESHPSILWSFNCCISVVSSSLAVTFV
jgi:hypothetical protein